MAKKQQGAPQPQTSSKDGGGVASVAQLFCTCKGCKVKPEKFGFCNDHYEHFKFGLINKKGEKVSDYDEKLDHFMTHKKAA